jgi:hypothetical protein
VFRPLIPQLPTALLRRPGAVNRPNLGPRSESRGTSRDSDSPGFKSMSSAGRGSSSLRPSSDRGNRARARAGPSRTAPSHKCAYASQPARPAYASRPARPAYASQPARPAVPRDPAPPWSQPPCQPSPAAGGAGKGEGEWPRTCCESYPPLSRL